MSDIFPGVTNEFPGPDQVLSTQLGNLNALQCPSDQWTPTKPLPFPKAPHLLRPNRLQLCLERPPQRPGRRQSERPWACRFDPHQIPLMFDKEKFHIARGDEEGQELPLRRRPHQKPARHRGHHRAEPVIQLKNLFKQFGQRMAVDDLTLQVPRGRNLRPARPQRRRQKHGHRHDARPGLADQRRGENLRPRRHRAPPAGAAEGRRDLRKPGLLRLPERAAEPGDSQLLHRADAPPADPGSDRMGRPERAGSIPRCGPIRTA